MLKTFTDYNISISASSGNTKVLCPECSHTRSNSKDPCLSVNVDEGVWNCHHCGWSGSLGNTTPLYKPAVKVYCKPKYKPGQITGKAAVFFKSRGISEQVLLRNKITGNDKNVEFPYIEGGEVKNVKTRLPGKDFRLVAGAELVAYGIDDMASSTYWVEGEMDKLALEECGFPNCVASPSAPPENAKKYNLSYLDGRDFSCVKKFYLAGDMDAPGRRLMSELSRRFGVERCLTVEWPAECKDANDTLVNFGKEKVQECLAGATPIPIAGIYQVNDYAVAVEELYYNGISKGVSVGFPSLDPHFTLMGSQWTLVTGAPGSGKSQFIDAIMINTILAHAWKWGICSMENQPVQLHLAKLVNSLNGLPFFNGHNQRLSPDDLNRSMSLLQEFTSFILPGDDITIENILKLAEIEVYRKGIKGLIIDPWNELDHPFGNMSETQYISQSIGKVRRFARKHDVHVFLVAHPTKLRKDDSGKYPVPTPYDVSGSAHWYNKADNAISTWRESYDSNVVDIHIQKIRFQDQVGKPGMISLTFDTVAKTYKDDLSFDAFTKGVPYADN